MQHQGTATQRLRDTQWEERIQLKDDNEEPPRAEGLYAGGGEWQYLSSINVYYVKRTNESFSCSPSQPVAKEAKPSSHQTQQRIVKASWNLEFSKCFIDHKRLF
jgi:hypothetical protein